MRELIGAALGPPARRLLLLDPPRALHVLAWRPATTFLVATSPRRRLLRSWREALAKRGAGVSARLATVALVAARADALPFARPRFDAVVAAAGLPPRSDAAGALETLRAVLRPGGALLVASRLREGDLGTAASLARRALGRQALPTGAELATAMLVAGLRRVRQARLGRAAVPTALTWGEARPRPWLDVADACPEPGDATPPADEISPNHEEMAAPNAEIPAPDDAPDSSETPGM
jgi:SAM-dependent methyltransferase